MRKRVTFTMMSVLSVLLACSLAAAQPAGLQPPKDPRCAVTAQSGPCKAMFERYYYDSKTGTCKPFFWGGCGEPEPFETKQECEKACTGFREGLEIKELRRLDKEGLPYASVAVRYPKTWENLKNTDITITLNGQEVPVKPWGSGFSPEWQEKTFLLFPGKAGKKELVVAAASKGGNFEARRSFDWHPAPILTILDGTGDNELLQTGRPLRIFAYLLDDIRITFNGVQVEAKPFLPATGPAALYMLDPPWKNGINTLTIRATRDDGNIEKKEYRFICLADAIIGQGETMKLRYGRPGSKSGPFFSFNIKGNAVTSKGSKEESYYRLDSEGWLSRDEAFVAELLAARPGESAVEVHEKPHFLQPAQLIRTINIKVLGPERAPGK